MCASSKAVTSHVGGSFKDILAADPLTKAAEGNDSLMMFNRIHNPGGAAFGDEEYDLMDPASLFYEGEDDGKPNLPNVADSGLEDLIGGTPGTVDERRRRLATRGRASTFKSSITAPAATSGSKLS